jgi:hypothetical protein
LDEGKEMATITGNLEDIVDSAPEEGSVVIALCGYGSQVPRVQGTAMLGSVTSDEIEVDADGSFEAEVPGNDQIEPAGTYYTLTVKDANGDVVQTNAYLFLGDDSYDMNGTAPFDPALPLPPLPPLIINQLLIVPFSPTPTFPGGQYTAWAITLTGDVTSSTLSGIIQGNLYTFIILQDSTGGRKFAWPSLVQNATPVNPNPSGLTVQTFVALANNGPLFPIGPATYFP